MIIGFLILFFAPLFYIAFFATLLDKDPAKFLTPFIFILALTVILVLGAIPGVGLATLTSGTPWIKQLKISWSLTGYIIDNTNLGLTAILIPYTTIIDIWMLYIYFNVKMPHIMLYIGEFPSWYILYNAIRYR